ncbi:MAG: chromate efflux transporter [Rhodospirillales bacterium]|nr:chromate efflux transporter [Rhodospirillales bacterium]
MAEAETGISPWTVFKVFLRLGCTSFGGPIAHIGCFQTEFVQRRKWLDERSFADLVALCQFLPGPASSQIGMGVGIAKAGVRGALAAWLGFTIPSTLLMLAFAYGLIEAGNTLGTGWLQGLKVMAVAVVAQAVWQMARNLCPDRIRQGFAVLAAILVLVWQGPLGHVAAICLGAVLGRFFISDGAAAPDQSLTLPIGRRTGLLVLGFFFLLLAGLPVAAALSGSHPVTVLDSFFRAGSLVFGGGHVLLPLLQAHVVPPGWVDTDTFLAGYGAAQALPGPLFAISAFLGTVMTPGGGVGLAMLCLLGIFLPSFLLLVGIMPFWNALRARPTVQSALMGVNAAVVGLLVAVLYEPVWTGTIHGPQDFVLLLMAFGALALFKIPPWLVALMAAGLGAIIGII